MVKLKKIKKYVVTDLANKESVEVTQVNQKSAAQEGVKCLYVLGKNNGMSGWVSLQGSNGTRLRYHYECVVDPTPPQGLIVRVQQA